MYSKLDLKYFAALLTVSITTYILYLQGVGGNFIFDDFPNLKLMEIFDREGYSLSTVKAYLDSSFSGPLKRPVSMLSFLLEYPSWPDSPSEFKRSNILYHCITGLSVAWLCYLLCHVYKKNHSLSLVVGVLSGSIFLLHPLHVSTVLYVVQRMAILSALFSILCIISYVKGRFSLADKKKRGWIYIFIICPTFFLLSILSKENGILTIWLVCLVEFCLLRKYLPLHGIDKRIINSCVFGASLLLTLFLIYQFFTVHLFGDSYARRDFSMAERLLTESRIVCDYIGKIVFPRMQTYGIFSDGVQVSKSLFHPITTILSLLVNIGLLTTAVVLYKRNPIITFGILFFYIGHFLESTYVPLELYYEHRNYLPSFGIIFLFSYLISFIQKAKLQIRITVITLLFGVLCLLLVSRTQLWGNHFLMINLWSESNPRSLRAQLLVSGYWMKYGNFEMASRYIDRSLEYHVEDPKPWLYAIELNCISGEKWKEVNITDVLRNLRESTYHQSTYSYLKSLTSSKMITGCKDVSYDDLISAYKALAKSKGSDVGNIQALFLFQIGNIYLAMREEEKAFKVYGEALDMRTDIGAGLVEMATLANLGYYDLALLHGKRLEKKILEVYQGEVGDIYSVSSIEWIHEEYDFLRSEILKSVEETKNLD